MNCATELFPYFSTLIIAMFLFIHGLKSMCSQPVERVETIRKFLNFSITFSVISEVVNTLIISAFSKSSFGIFLPFLRLNFLEKILFQNIQNCFD